MCVSIQLWNRQEAYFRETGYWGLIVKKSFFHLWKLDSFSSKPARKTHSFIFLFIKITALTKFLSFVAETGFLPLLAGMLADSTFNLIRVARGMTVETHTALSPDLFFFFMKLYSVSKVSFLKALNMQRNLFCVPGNWDLMVKIIFSHCKSWVLQWHLPEKLTASFLHSLQQQLSPSICVFWKYQAVCRFLLRSHLTVQFHLIRVTTGMEVNTQRTLSSDLFSHEMVHCILGMSLHNTETAVKLFFFFFLELCFWGLMAKKKVFFPV